MMVLRAASGWGPHRRRVVDILQLGAAEGRHRKHPQPWVVHRARHWRRSQNRMPHQRTLSSSFHLRLVLARLAHGPGTVWVLGSHRRAGHTLLGEGIPLVVLPLESSRLCLVALKGLGGKEGCARHELGGWNQYEEAGGNSSWNPTISFSSTKQGEPGCVQGRLYL